MSTNEVINESPGDWLLGVLARAKARSTNERYTITMALPISKDQYQKLFGKL
jgi:hypothetical protein